MMPPITSEGKCQQSVTREILQNTVKIVKEEHTASEKSLIKKEGVLRWTPRKQKNRNRVANVDAIAWPEGKLSFELREDFQLCVVQWAMGTKAKKKNVFFLIFTHHLAQPNKFRAVPSAGTLQGSWGESDQHNI